jgi:SAM-dependent methyltransferase
MNFVTMNQQLTSAMVLHVALETGLLETLLGRSVTPESAARDLGLDARAAGRVLDVLWAFDLADREDRTYSASALLLEIERRHPSGVALIKRFDEWALEFLKTGKSVPRMDQTIADRERGYAKAVPWLGEMFQEAAQELVGRIGPARRILDVGAGSGVWSLEMASRSPDARVTALDLPGVLPAFLDGARTRGLGDRVDTVAGDFHEVVPKGDFDRVVLANILHLEAPDAAARVLSRMAAAVAPGGELVVVDAFARGTREEDVALTLYAFGLAMRTVAGQVYEVDTIRSWSAAAGFPVADFHPLAGAPGALGAIVARR